MQHIIKVPERYAHKDAGGAAAEAAPAEEEAAEEPEEEAGGFEGLGSLFG